MSDQQPILVINGPNLNLLGTRQPEIYGSTTLADIEELCAHTAGDLGRRVECFQSNHEGEIVERIHAGRRTAAGLVINAGAYTHTSIAIRDAVLAAEFPMIEVHLSNVHAREPFRHTSYLADIAVAVISGLGVDGYQAAIRFLALQNS